MNLTSWLPFTRKPTSGPLARADGQLARSVLAVFALGSTVAVLGPLISYRSDVAELQDLFRARVVRESTGDANALDRHLRLLQSELERLADRPEVNLLDGSMRPEQELLDSAHRNSTLFDSGVAIVDAAGTLVWAEPADLKAAGLITGDWFKRLAATHEATQDITASAQQTFLVAVPVLRDGVLTGALVGLSRPVRTALAPATSIDPVARVIRDARGNLSLSDQPPPWTMTPDFLSKLQALPKVDGPFRLDSGEELFASSTPLSTDGISMVEVGNEEQITRPVRYRFQLQMALLTSLQTGAVLLLSLFLRRTYASFLAIERRALEQDRLLALGSASALIAHEVKNSLNGLQAAASLLSSLPPGGSPSDVALPVKSIRGEVDRLKHLASSLLLFGRPADVQMRLTSLPQLAREAVEGLNVMPEADEVRIDLDVPEELEIPCDPLLLTTAVHNIARNAVEAAIGAKDLGKVSAPRVLVRVVRRGDVARIEVEDNAGGIAPEVAERLFEPFFTGKPKGIGLGLSMTKRAMEAQGGSVQVEGTLDGSRFVLTLPVPVEEQSRLQQVLATVHGGAR